MQLLQYILYTPKDQRPAWLEPRKPPEVTKDVSASICPPNVNPVDDTIVVRAIEVWAEAGRRKDMARAATNVVTSTRSYNVCDVTLTPIVTETQLGSVEQREIHEIGAGASQTEPSYIGSSHGIEPLGTYHKEPLLTNN